MNRITLFTAFGLILFQWTFVYSLTDATGSTKQHKKDVQVSDNHKNTLLDFLYEEDRQKFPGETQLHSLRRSKRRDITFFSSVATISQKDALRLLAQVFINVIKATIRQGKPPLRPKFPEPIISMLKESMGSNL